MRNFLPYLIQNSYIVFSLAGISLTLYLSLLAYPRYLQQQRDSRVAQLNSDMIKTLENLIVQEERIQPSTLNALIRGKEIRMGVKYPYTIDELMYQTQESLMENRFIPFEQRQQFVAYTDSLRVRIARDTEAIRIRPLAISSKKDPPKTFFSTWSPRRILIGSLGVLLSLFGIYSIYYKSRLEQNIEFEKIMENNREMLEDQLKLRFHYEAIVRQAIQALRFEISTPVDVLSKADFRVKGSGGREIFIKARYLSDDQRLSPIALKQFAKLVKQFNAYGMLITNTEDKNGFSLVDRHNHKNPRNTIYTIIGETKDEIQGMLLNTVNRVEGRE
jgi:hypothetical protein